MAKLNGPSKNEQLKWQAEDVVRQSISSTPAYKKAVRETMKQLKSVQKNASNIIRNKKK